MAADVKLAPGRYWSTTSGLLGYVIERLATHAENDEVAAELRLVDQANLGVLDLDEFSPSMRRRLLDYIAEGLLRDAADSPPPSAPNWGAAMSALSELADDARSVLRTEPDGIRAVPDSEVSPAEELPNS